jgi:transcriptional regulator with XRE-family HTH domain
LSSLGHRIEKKRESLKLSKLEMAAKLGISDQLLGLYERGERNPKTKFYLKWKEVFNDDLLQTNVSNETVESRLLRLEANAEVFQVAIAAMRAKRKEDFPQRFSELQTLIEEAVRRRAG